MQNFKNKKTQGYTAAEVPLQGDRNKPAIPQGSNQNKPAFNLGYEKNRAEIKGQGNK